MPTVSAKVSDIEKKEFQDIAESYSSTVSGIIKMAFHNAKIKDHTLEKNTNEDRKRFGRLLNQVAKRCNTLKLVDEETQDALLRIEAKMDLLIKEVRK